MLHELVVCWARAARILYLEPPRTVAGSFQALWMPGYLSGFFASSVPDNTVSSMGLSVANS